MFVIKPTGGLGNCLRVVFSCFVKCKENNENLYVIWQPSAACPGFFLDYFEEIEGITFSKTNKLGLKVDYQSSSSYPNYSVNLENLKLRPHLQKIVDNNIKLLDNNFIATHIRRTDHDPYINNKKHTTDLDFIKFINDNPKFNIYIATDNRATQDKFIKLYEDRIKIIKLIEKNNNNMRKTLLEDSIIELFTCVYANNFKGSYYSTFSEMIFILRERIHNGRNIDKYELKEFFKDNI